MMPEKVFGNYEFFRDGHRRLRKDFVECAKRFSNGSGGDLYCVGDPMDKLYFVGDGALDVYVTGYSGRKISLYSVGPGELCPINLGAVISDSTALANANARRGFESATMSAAAFRRIMVHHPDFRDFVIGCMATKFQSIVRQIAEVTTRSVDARIEQFFRDRFDQCDEHGVLAVTNAEIGRLASSEITAVDAVELSVQAALVELGMVFRPEHQRGWERAISRANGKAMTRQISVATAASRKDDQKTPT